MEGDRQPDCLLFAGVFLVAVKTPGLQVLHTEFRQSSTGSVVINTMLPRRHGLEAL